MSSKLKLVLSLFLTFLKIGAFTFGGGYAMIPLMQRETSEKRQWINDDELANIITIAESTPGPIAVNSATFIGYKVAGLTGSVFATLGVVVPSFIIILFISCFYKSFNEIRFVRYAFWGIRSAVIALIFKAWFFMFKKCNKNVFSIILIVLALLLALFTKISAVYIIIIGGISGFVYNYCLGRRNRL